MSLDLHSLAWHRSVGKLIMQLNRPEFWSSLIRVLNEYVQIDNWVVLVFGDHSVRVISLPEVADSEEVDAFIHRYVKGLYLLDPFYIADRENPQSGFFHLLDIAPEHFLETEYYHQYFAQFISVDEAQYNVRLDADRTLCMSFGSNVRFTQAQVTMLDMIKPWVTAMMHQRMCFESDQEKNIAEPAPWAEAIAQLEAQITTREKDVLKLLLSGFSNKEIAGKLSLSTETIKVHRRNIYSKLNIKSQSELFARFFMPRQDAPAAT
ncbi:helix-turn-helix transcriptional regulator [Pseudomonas synxantha]|uniref:LuxR family transcriptional regulator n=1 Tax=Pseudomonas libanensis TaxID=75588 RepID=A0A0R2Y2D9_9PSED|nr:MULTISPECIES: LuxR C-terminal-related transcriptional regulator [Pseudomonas]AMS21178.1 helix-turn-helix transcriptional regulator [Pseudomonas synxantha]KRA19181.1 LuxR family transcriptional regulator [Pseudomonas sp. Root569]KRP42445.1 LuxR family transcriptional regulator [Pseudomonas libanensis]MDT3231918.1 LuxR C-terminal-related transcriptional regulator [Pseudomonas sp. rhizo25]SDK87886.1 regulatory protein, luxR family [Pseudomonas libanensis]